MASRTKTTRRIRQAAALGGLALLAGAAHGVEPDPRGQVATLPSVGEHWVWVTDRLLAHSQLFDGDTAKALGTIDAGTTITPKAPLYSPERNEFYAVEIDYARGRRGERTDYVTIYDAETLAVTGEIVFPTKAAESNSSVAYTGLLDGGRFLAVTNAHPNASLSILDLHARSFVGEVVAGGCAGVYPTGERSFGMLCGNGTALAVSLDEEGRLLERTPGEKFFDAVEDPVMLAAARLGSRWLHVSFGGVVHEVDYSKTPPGVTAWRLVDGDDEGWRPGGLQHVAAHRTSQRLYVVVHEGGPGSHKDPGPEVWVFDVGKRERVGRFTMPNFTAAFLATTLGLGDGFAGWLLHRLLPGGGAHAIAVTQDDAPLLFARNADLGVVAVLDARTGEHLRNLDEVGLSGPTLEVPR